MVGRYNVYVPIPTVDFFCCSFVATVKVIHESQTIRCFGKAQRIHNCSGEDEYPYLVKSGIYSSKYANSSSPSSCPVYICSYRVGSVWWLQSRPCTRLALRVPPTWWSYSLSPPRIVSLSDTWCYSPPPSDTVRSLSRSPDDPCEPAHSPPQTAVHLCGNNHANKEYAY